VYPEWNTLALVRALHTSGHAVLERPVAEPALALACAAEFDVILWGCFGAAADRTALSRLALSGTPLVAVLANPEPAAFAICLESGADACLTIDTDARVVAAQVSAVLRRRRPTGVPASSGNFIQVGDLTVDCDRCEVERDGTFIPLTATEFRVIEYMARNAGKLLRPQEILNAATEEYVYNNREAQDVFKVYARRIRRKIERDEGNPRYLVNVRGFGYRLEDGLNHREFPFVRAVND
jgi:DNA-binding response OmpR family regulator